MADPYRLLTRLLEGGPVRRRDLEHEVEAVLRPEDLVSASDVVSALLELHADEFVVCEGGNGEAVVAARNPGRDVVARTVDTVGPGVTEDRRPDDAPPSTLGRGRAP